MIFAAPCFSLLISTSSTAPAGYGLEALSVCVSGVMFLKLVKFALVVCQILPLALESSVGDIGLEEASFTHSFYPNRQ